MPDKMIVTKSKLDALATSISNKSGVSVPMTIAQMKTAVDGITTGSGGTPTLQAKTNITPTESIQTIEPDNGYDGLSSVQINAISSSYIGSGVDQRDSTDLSAVADTVTAPAGYYSTAATYTISSGTEGTPTATKGTVSNNSITVTPSVTNTAGYIAGGTHNGTGVTVSASELVSGSLSIDDDGTYDVTNYASAAVAIDYASKVRTVTFTVTRQDTSSIFSFHIYGSFTSLDFSDGIKTISKGFSVLQGVSTGTATVYIPKSRPIIVFGCTSSLGNYDVTVDSAVGECIDVPHILGASNTNITKAIYLKTNAPDSITIGITPYSQTLYPETVVLDTLSASSNGTYTPTSGTAYSSVTVSVQPNNQNKTVTPTTSQQSVTFDVDNNNYTGLGTVTVNAIPSNYVDASNIKSYYTGSSTPSSSLGNNGDLYFQTV